MRSFVWGLFALLVLCVLGCAGSGVSVGSGPVGSIKITPNPANLKPNEKIQLTAILDGGTAPVTWSVTTASGGSITQGGVYTAPSASGDYEIKVVLTSDASKFGTTTAKVDSGYKVSIQAPNGSQNFAGFGIPLNLTAKVEGAASNRVTWTTSSSTATIDASGQFLSSAASPEDVTVTATSVDDPGKKATTVIHVVAPLQVIDDAASTLATPSSYHQFSAKLVGIPGTATWSATSGTVDSTGKWTADASFTGSVDVTAQATIGGTNYTKTVALNVVSNLNVRFSFQDKGDVVLALRPDKAPKTCANLVSLANSKFYDGIFVHRYEAGFVVQWGDPLTKTLPLDDPSIGTGGPGYNIDFESNDLLHLKYSLGMARAGGLNTAGSQIYLCLNDLPSLDGSYVVFGSVLSGTSIVDALRAGDKILTARVELP